MKRDTPPFRADHVGSLLRPPELLQARADHKAGTITDEQLRSVEDAAIADVVRMQEELGLLAITDGEFRRGSWHMDFIYQLDGITREAGHIAVRFHRPDGDIEFTPAALHVNGKLGVWSGTRRLRLSIRPAVASLKPLFLPSSVNILEALSRSIRT